MPVPFDYFSHRNNHQPNLKAVKVCAPVRCFSASSEIVTKKSSSSKRTSKKSFVFTLSKEQQKFFDNLTKDGIFKYTWEDLDFAKSIMKDNLTPEMLDELDLDKLSIAPTERYDEHLKRMCLDLLVRIPYKQKPIPEGQNTGDSQNTCVSENTEDEQEGGKPKLEVQDFYIVLEHKSYPDRWALFQGAGYVSDIWKEAQKQHPELLPTTILMIVHQGPKAYNGPTNFCQYFTVHPAFKRYIPSFEAIIYDTSAEKGEIFVDDPNVPLKKFVLEMMRIVSMVRPGRSAQKWLNAIKRVPYSRKSRELRLIFLLSLLKFTKLSKKRIKQMNLQTRTEEYQEEDFVDRLAEIEKKGIKKGIQEGIQKGIQEGIQKGRHEGRQEGRQEVQQEYHKMIRSSILDSLRKRFTTLSRRVTSGLKQVNDVMELVNMAAVAKNCHSIQEFEKLLPAPTGR